MKKAGLPLGIIALSTVCACGQVTVEVQLEQEQFLPGESLPASVRITNRSGQTLKLGATEDWLTFSIEDGNGLVLPQIGDIPVQGEFILENSKRAIKHVDLAPCLRRGTNVLGLMLGNGWFNPYPKWWEPYRMQWFGSKRALLQLHLDCHLAASTDG